jgi:hypothetical protein
MDSINDALMDNLEGEILLQGELVGYLLEFINLLTLNSSFLRSNWTSYLNNYQTKYTF